MDIMKLESAFSNFEKNLVRHRLFWGLGFNLSDGEGAVSMSNSKIYLSKYDFSYHETSQFTWDEAMLIKEVGKKYHFRLLTPSEWSGIMFWLLKTEDCQSGKLGIRYLGYASRESNFSREQEGVAYYWTDMTRDYCSNSAFAFRIFANGDSQLLPYPKVDKMNVRLVYQGF